MELTAHLLTLNEPFTSNAYTLRNSILEQYPDSPVSSYIDGDMRRKVIYPRVHFTVINNMPIIVSMNDSIDVIRQFAENLKTLEVMGKTWHVQKIDTVQDNTDFTRTDHKCNYRFLTPWVGLNRQNLVKYKYLYTTERTGFLNRMLMQNIEFLMQEFGYTPSYKITCRIRMNGLSPEICPDTHMGFFSGSFITNVYLPAYLGMGCGISRGFGTIMPVESPPSPENKQKKPHLSD